MSNFYLTLYHQSRLLTTLHKKTFENNVGIGENADNQHFFLFPQCFLPVPKQISVAHILSSVNVLSLGQSKNLLFGKEFNDLTCVCFWEGTKQHGKRRKCWLNSIFPLLLKCSHFDIEMTSFRVVDKNWIVSKE